MTVDNEDGWLDVEAVIDCEVTACYLNDGFGILAEVVTNQAAHRIVWTAEQAAGVLDQWAEELDRIGDLIGGDDDE